MGTSWSVLAWNLNHRARRRAIPSVVAEVVAGLDVDIAFLNEFVDGPTRGIFREQLASLGYPYHLVSHKPANNNQVFAASRLPISVGDLAPPTTNTSAIANWLHLRIAGSEIELLGLRVPAYTTGTERKAYRDELATILRSAQDRALVVTGDLNEDPFARAGGCPPASVAFRGAEMFSVVYPTGTWSYINHRGTSTSRIDHVMHTSRLRVADARYHYELGEVRIAGPTEQRPLSDHAALVFSVEAK